MATTDARTGFRLPWSSDQRSSDDRHEPEASADEVESVEAAVSTHHDPAHVAETPAVAAQPLEGDTMIETAASVADAGTSVTEAPVPTPVTPVRPSPKKPSKFLADLTKAMQTAAEAAREETLGRLQADAKTHVEEIHTRSATEAADLRRRADDDVAEIREWSKAEIARIREETETRIASRKSRLETEIEEHGALIERQVERVQGRVAAFEDEMTRFFEALLAEEDPTRFAAMAASLPEPPPFDIDDVAASAAAAMVTESETAPALASEGASVATDWSAEPAPEPVDDPEAAMAAIQAAAEAAAAAEQAELAGEAGAEPVTDEPATTVDEAAVVEATDPRLAALGYAGGFAEAEAEAFAAATTDQDVDIPTIADEALAARLAGLVPAEDGESVVRSLSTAVVVTGLVSVASIASFKRHLGRLAGVQSVGVSSGPEGEFVFTVSHGEEVNLRDAVATLPGFGARVTGGTGHQIDVTAKDPENEA